MISKILVSGKDFLRSDFSPFLPVLEDLIYSSEKEILLATYVITDSAIDILEILSETMGKGVKIKIVVNHINKKDTILKKWIKDNQKKYPGFIFKLFNHDDALLHAKVIISDRKKAIFGSANYTWSGMIKNYEIGAYFEGSEIWKLASLIDLTFFT